MLYSKGQVLLREVEHVEDDRLLASVLAMVDGVHHLYDSLALMHRFLLAVLSDDGELTLNQDTVVHNGMMMPAQLLTSGEYILHCYKLRATLKIVGQLNAIPTLAGAYKFG